MHTAHHTHTGAPDASLAARDLPKGDASFLAKHGCGGEVRTDIFLDATGELTEEAMRESLKCIRLRLYSGEEARFAIASGHLETWAGPPANAQTGPLLAKDAMVVRNNRIMCANALTTEQIEAQKPLMDRASRDLSAAVRAETNALVGCASLLEAAFEQLRQRLEG